MYFLIGYIVICFGLTHIGGHGLFDKLIKLPMWVRKAIFYPIYVTCIMPWQFVHLAILGVSFLPLLFINELHTIRDKWNA